MSELVIRSTARTVDLVKDGHRHRAWLWEATLPGGEPVDVYVVGVSRTDLPQPPGLFGPDVEVVEPEEIG
jgi:hypothetical protein